PFSLALRAGRRAGPKACHSSLTNSSPKESGARILLHSVGPHTRNVVTYWASPSGDRRRRLGPSTPLIRVRRCRAVLPSGGEPRDGLRQGVGVQDVVVRRGQDGQPRRASH